MSSSEGMITPAISVLGAVEGLQVEMPLFAPSRCRWRFSFVLFLFQKFGTHRVGRLFGPIMVLWFATIAVLGISWIVREPTIIGAIGVAYFRQHGLPGVAMLGAVFLAVTGGEAALALTITSAFLATGRRTRRSG